MAHESRASKPAIRVHQWLPEWEDVDFDDKAHRRRPPDHFLLFSMNANDLRRLAGIQRRSVSGQRPRHLDLGIQRTHDADRSEEIREYVRHGFPWSALGARKKNSDEYNDLRKPGWLPTAIVVNILLPSDSREGRRVDSSDVIHISDATDTLATLSVPTESQPRDLPPIEIIDGQHRLWAFRDAIPEYELPVVAFHGLDISWQAYLFYTINIKPKRINTSLAFDLYPLLRTEEWLDRFEGHSVYRETRAQELTEQLWSYPDSPWHERINMLGERGRKSVTQASWIRSLLATFVKAYEGRGVKIGGLFGAPVGEHSLALPWTRAQQAAFLIAAWELLRTEIAAIDEEWARTLRDEEADTSLDPAFAGPSSLLNSDIGVRGYLYIVNDLCFWDADELELWDWLPGDVENASGPRAIETSLESLRQSQIHPYLLDLAKSLAPYDWRSSKAPGLSEGDRMAKARFRGGSGYRELRMDLLRHVIKRGQGPVTTAAAVAEALGFKSRP